MRHQPTDSHEAELDSGNQAWDPTFLNTRREARIIFCVWIAALLWALPVSALMGYADGADVTTTLGIPSWVFYGVAAPWMLSTLFAVWFSMRFMADDDLGRAPEEEAA